MGRLVGRLVWPLTAAPARRRGAWAGGALAGFALVLVAALLVVLVLARWWPRAALSPAAVAASTPAVEHALAAVHQPPASAAATALRAPASASASAAGRVWDLCGVGRVPIPPGLPASGNELGDLPDLPEPLGRQALALARQRTLAVLQAGTPRQRAAALVLGPALPALSQQEALDQFSAAASAAAAAAAGLPRPPRGDDPALRELTALARDSSDPVVQALAHRGCSLAADAGACRRNAARTWAQAQPDNAMPWALLADEDADPAVQTEAWRGIQQASLWDAQWGAVSAVVQGAVPADVPVYLRTLLGVETIGIDASMSLPGSVFKWCRPAPEPGSQRQKECSRVATLMVEQSDTLLIHALGVRMGELAGWPAERIAVHRAEVKALLARDQQLPFDRAQPLNCVSAAQMLGQITAVGRLGELGAAREHLKALTRDAQRR